MKLVRWIGRSREDLRKFPSEARRSVGIALHFAQAGDLHPSAKPLHGFGGAAVLEIVENRHGNAYRAVYTVRFEEVLYVLHCFKRKSRRGVKTPQHEIELIKDRLKWAEEDYRLWQGTENE